MKNQNVKTIAGLAIIAGAAIGAVLYYRKQDVSDLRNKAADSINDLGLKIRKYGIRVKNRLLNHVTGPDGEPVYIDMYDRQFYEDTDGKRVYIQTV